MAKLKIVLKRSLIGRKEKHRRTIRALGLKKINSQVIHNDTPQIRGMIRQVAYLLEVEELKE
ncbi:50S ribosomal protein L30 [Candidatus Sumerlaeota bacterium]|nr:50S ribosomal protein L30 [Candidatus Sumerlaeota bacterium]